MCPFFPAWSLQEEASEIIVSAVACMGIRRHGKVELGLRKPSFHGQFSRYLFGSQHRLCLSGCRSGGCYLVLLQHRYRYRFLLSLCHLYRSGYRFLYPPRTLYMSVPPCLEGCRELVKSGAGDRDTSLLLPRLRKIMLSA
eukprot:TRINITY_DN31001_c0_g1_i1.p1 TRINITY_DN31001_c0_g1~~TRINITY_DN31001_c0_g1_i1.p1  ORF type:complete len:140 (+),score=0.74 TRINITY_DN31001_c0_g1_i1:62-481(+)